MHQIMLNLIFVATDVVQEPQHTTAHQPEEDLKDTNNPLDPLEEYKEHGGESFPAENIVVDNNVLQVSRFRDDTLPTHRMHRDEKNRKRWQKIYKNAKKSGMKKSIGQLVGKQVKKYLRKSRKD